VDIAWYDPTARSHGYNENAPIVLDDYGRQLPAPLRFPSSASGAGFGPLAAKVHELGLRFGLHIMRGIPRPAVELDLPVFGTQWTAREIADSCALGHIGIRAERGEDRSSRLSSDEQKTLLTLWTTAS